MLFFPQKNPALRREALALYREIIRTCNAFYWADKNGQPWSLVLRQSARKEFENNRNLVDALEIKRQIMMGYESVDEVRRRFNAAEQKIKERVQNTKLR